MRRTLKKMGVAATYGLRVFAPQNSRVDPCKQKMVRTPSVSVSPKMAAFRIRLSAIMKRRWANGEMVNRQSGRKHTEKSKRKMAKAKARWWKDNPEKAVHCRMMIAKNHARHGLGKFGPQSSGWKGGRYTVKRDGYVYVYAPTHPFAKRSGQGGGGYVLEHRLIMERIIGRYLHQDEDVNHVNGNKGDNRPENLRLVLHHAHYHPVCCPKCGFAFATR